MLPELRQKRDAVVVARTPVLPTVIGSTVIRHKSKKQVLKRLKRGQARGYYAGASELARVSARMGGGWAVKVHLLKPEPEPIPGWAKGLIWVGVAFTACGLVGLLVLRAMASMFAVASTLPWGIIMGGLIILALIIAGTKVGRAAVRVVVDVTVR